MQEIEFGPDGLEDNAGAIRHRFNNWPQLWHQNQQLRLALSREAAVRHNHSGLRDAAEMIERVMLKAIEVADALRRRRQT